MAFFETCPRCNSDNVTGNRKRNEAHCDDCGFPKDVAVATNTHEATCRDLAETECWVDEVIESWPGPIAHEYLRLRELLREGQIVGAIWKLKDLAEILTRFPACVMACDVLANSTDSDNAAKIRDDLLGKVMTMGSWHEFASKIALHMLKNTGGEFICPTLPELFHEKQANEKFTPTSFSQLLAELTEWRNSSFAHGALRLNLEEFIQDLEEYLPRLHTSLADFSKKKIWHECILLADDGTRLMGATSIHDQHRKQHRGHEIRRIPLKLRSGDRELSLTPYALLRRCDECQSQDVFLFDWRRAKKNGRDHYRFIDYLAGHHIESPWWRETDLDKEASCLAASPIANAVNDDLTLDQDLAYLIPEVDKLLTDCSISKHYETPDYLRKGLAQFVREEAQGIWWLKAPGHVGKSTFIAGIDPKLRAHYGGSLLGDDLCVAVFYIRREYQNGPGQLSEQLYLAINEALGIRIGPGGRPVRQLDLDATDSATEFAIWLGEFMKAAKLSGRSRKLLICIDGLDELPLPEAGQRSIADFVPSSDALPKDVYLVLTSRPDDELPAWLLPRLENRLAQATVKNIGLNDKDYVKLMYAYFKKRLAHRVEEALENQPDQTKEKVADLKPLFDESLIRSGGRFLYLGYIVDRLADSTLKFDDLKKLPAEDQLFEHFFDEIKRIHQGSNLDDYFERLLLHLVAAEHAFELDRESLPVVAREATWPGLPLEVLSRRVDAHPEGKITVKLAYALYTLKPVLGTWRGGGEGQANYRIGLKGLSEVLGRRYGERLRILHAGLVEGLVGQFGPAESVTVPELDEDMQLRLRYAAIHAQIGGVQALHAMKPYSARLAEMQLTHADSDSNTSRVLGSTRWYSATIALLETKSEPSDTQLEPIFANKLAGVYMSRGVDRQSAGDASGAVTDYNLAITLREGLRERLADQWPPEFANELASVYKNRGNVHMLACNTRAAVADYNTAVTLRERLREQLGKQWLPDFANDLALVYMNRGVARKSTGDAAGCLTDYNAAIALREVLREQRGKQWSPKFANSLASAYMNRGNSRLDAGDAAGCLSDYDAAIALREALREQFGEQWSPKFANDLALVYNNRGVARKSTGDTAGALTDNDSAIALQEALREQLGEQWSPGYANDLASSYSNRGLARKSTGDAAGCLTDYDTAIALRETLREQLGEQWPPQFANSLAAVYINRAGARQFADNATGCLTDYDSAIALQESLREQLGEQWPPQFANDLAKAYMNRGVARKSTGDAAGCLTDHDAAIALRESLREQLGEQWPPEFANSLASTYSNRGIARKYFGDVAGCLTDYDAAIALREALRVQLGEQWLPEFANSLAFAYINRGNARKSTGDVAGCLTDYDAAIALQEALREQLGEQWPPAFANDLASAYSSRGIARRSHGDAAGALTDYDNAIALREALRKRLGSQWSPGYANDLASAFINRGVARKSTGDAAGSLTDYDTAILLHEALREQLGEQWPPEFAHNLAQAYTNRGHSRLNAGDQTGSESDLLRARSIRDLKNHVS
jgi:hypothetical protein